jgi:SAM-dependent methyltransferase
MIPSVYRAKSDLIEDLIKPEHIVLDVGFWGQAVKRGRPDWPHGLLKKRAKEVYGVDVAFEESELEHPERYFKASAEKFSLPQRFEIIFASELIEHLSNPGLFLECARRHLKPDGVLILTTPNAFSFFPLVEKIFKDEPSVNPEHTLYFNKVVLLKLLDLSGFKVTGIAYIDTFTPASGLRRILRLPLRAFSFFTPKFLETLVVVAKIK